MTNKIKNIKKIVLNLPYIGFLWFSCQYACAFDLISSYTSALAYNADFLASIAKNQAGQENQIQGRATLLPQVIANGAITENYLSSAGTTVVYHQPTVLAQLSQVAFDFNKFSAYTKAKYATQVADLQLELAKQQLMINVAQAYFNVLYAIDSLNAIQMTKIAFERQVKQAKQAFKVGTVTITDVNDAQSSYDTSVAQEIQAQNNLINNKNIFRNITGLDPEQIQPLIEDISLVNPDPNDVSKWSQMAKINNINIKIAKKQLEMSDQDVSIAIAGHLPVLNVVGNYTYQGDSGIDGSSVSANQPSNTPGSLTSVYSTAALGLQLNLPIYSGGAVSSQVRQARATYIASIQQLVSTQRTTDQNIQNAFWQVQNGVGIVKAQIQALKSAQIKLKSDKNGYAVGVRNSIDLVNSEKNNYQVIQNYNQSRYNYLNYRLQLEFLAGKINQAFLKEINIAINQKPPSSKNYR